MQTLSTTMVGIKPESTWIRASANLTISSLGCVDIKKLSGAHGAVDQ
jgi:hypothetical protein